MNVISFDGFSQIYEDTVDQVYDYWSYDMQVEMSRHCFSWRPELFDFKKYLKASSIRYYYAYRSFSDGTNYRSLCDVGGLWGVFAITMKTLGADVYMTESLKYYGTAFTALFNYLSSRGVRIIDYDPFQANPPPSQYDFVTLMAVLEHYPHSLRILMDNISAMMQAEGRLYIEVPNIAYWPKRVALLQGQTPLAPQYDIYKSEVPFIGHHYEFTIAELRTLPKLSDLEIVREFFYNYSNRESFHKKLYARPFETIIQFLWPETRECLAVLCKKKVKI
jgi:2-polyprenyl-3-methyl-5-hydroxy-6-metoxy-1,4-benzoquinol methylase